MLLHEIHNADNSYVIQLLEKEFSMISDEAIIKNYHPDYIQYSGNFFNVLDQGRYSCGHGKYYVVEEDGKYVCSAGWNEYDLDPTIALCLTRMYVSADYRSRFLAAEYIIPLVLSETQSYNKVWITCNTCNKTIYDWFVRADEGKSTGLFTTWPKIYRQFKPVGIKEVYYTEQYVAELKR